MRAAARETYDESPGAGAPARTGKIDGEQTSTSEHEGENERCGGGGAKRETKEERSTTR